MGACCCTCRENESQVADGVRPGPVGQAEAMEQSDALVGGQIEVRRALNKAVDVALIDNLVLETLKLVSTSVVSGDHTAVSLLCLQSIAESGAGWTMIIKSMLKMIPLDNPLGPSIINIIMDDCPLPARTTVLQMFKELKICYDRVVREDYSLPEEVNLCVVIGCIADKLVGPNSVAVMTNDVLDYLFGNIITQREPRPVLFSIIALEKFAQTSENKAIIQERIQKSEFNCLIPLEQFDQDTDLVWRQIGFNAKWALDNIFLVEGRPLSYETVDVSGINVMLNTQDVSEYLKISPNGLEARSDTYSFESVRCTFQVNEGCWYYEVTVVSAGVMQVGWATKNSHFLNHEGYGIGDDEYSISFDGCRQHVWYNAKTLPTNSAPWQPGDVVGCLIDLDRLEVIFSLNGHQLQPLRHIFEKARSGFFAGASFMFYQQCMFNFGHEPFKYPPKDRVFTCFNDYGTLTDEQKKIFPKNVNMKRLAKFNDHENSCILCYDNEACSLLQPCQHRGFCAICSFQLTDCPLCRSKIKFFLPEAQKKAMFNGQMEERVLGTKSMASTSSYVSMV